MNESPAQKKNDIFWIWKNSVLMTEGTVSKFLGIKIFRI
jgi:hypothetical protein